MGNSTDETSVAKGPNVVNEAEDQTKTFEQALTDVEQPRLFQNVSAEELGKMIYGRTRALKLCQQFNNLPMPDCFPGMTFQDFGNVPGKSKILSELFNITPERAKKDLVIMPQFWCDYGFNIELKGSCFFNWNCTILDAGKITIGDHAVFGPGVSLFGSGHSLDHVERLTTPALRFDITLGDDVWIGGNSTIIGPCTIGNRVVVVGGSVVVKGTWPDDVVIGGNPARILKHIKPGDKTLSS